jgi:hypothetical protein
MARTAHKWAFSARFRKGGFGWRSQPAITRIKEAVAEIKKTARTEPVLGAEGAVLFLERVSPAIEQVDGSSGAIGTAVNNAIDTLVPVIVGAPADEALRQQWLERLWEAVERDDIPYLDVLPEYWGALCSTPSLASQWADNFIGIVRMAWGPDRSLRGHFKGTDPCLSALFMAGRHDEILELLKLAPFKFWSYHQWGVRALAALGRVDEAIRYAEDSRGRDNQPFAIARTCEEILLAAGRTEEAYSRYAFPANQKTTYLATFQAIRKKYPHKNAAAILSDLARSTPGEEGKWFAAARSAGLYAEAIELANRSPCDPRTLTRAARDLAEDEPRFAAEAGLAALRWLTAGHGYDITGLDVREAYECTLKAADRAGCLVEAIHRVQELAAADHSPDRFVLKILGPVLGLSQKTR